MSFQAGMTSEDHPERLLIALEPEAASIYVRKLRLYQLVPETPVTQTLGRSSSSTTRVNRYSYVPDTTVTGIISTSRCRQCLYGQLSVVASLNALKDLSV